MQYLANISAFTALQNRCGTVNAKKKEQSGSVSAKDSKKKTLDPYDWGGGKPDWAGMAAYAASALMAYSPLVAAGVWLDKIRNNPPEEPIPVVEVVDKEAADAEKPNTLFSFSDLLKKGNKEDMEKFLPPTKNNRKSS